MKLSNFLLKPLLVLAVAVPAMMTFNVSEAEARHKYRGAVIAGAIIGGAIAYHHYKKRHKHRYYGHYGHPRYGVRHYHRHYHGHAYKRHYYRNPHRRHINPPYYYHSYRGYR